MAEAQIAGWIGGSVGGRAILGQIDRLVVTATEVVIVDYKTHRPPPATPGDVAPLYLAQMAAYRALLAPLYPGRRVRAVLAWTDGPKLMELPDALLDRYAPSLASG